MPKKFLLFVLLSLIGINCLQAQPYPTWTGASDNIWNNAGNWQNGVPALNGRVYFDGSGNPVITNTVRYSRFYYTGSTDYTLNTNQSETIGNIYNQSNQYFTYDNSANASQFLGIRSGIVVLSGSNHKNRGTERISVQENGASEIADTTHTPTLLVNGYLYSSNYIYIGSQSAIAYNATLGGSGTIKALDNGVDPSHGSGLARGQILIYSGTAAGTKGAIIAPGDPRNNNGIGKLTLITNLNITNGYDSAAGSRFDFQINSLASYDQLDIQAQSASAALGNLSIGANTQLNLIFGDLSTLEVGNYDLITYAGTLTGWANLSWYGDWATQLDNYGIDWDIINADNKITFSINSIPEPSTWCLLGIGAATTAFLRRRKV